MLLAGAAHRLQGDRAVERGEATAMLLAAVGTGVRLAVGPSCLYNRDCAPRGDATGWLVGGMLAWAVMWGFLVLWKIRR